MFNSRLRPVSNHDKSVRTIGTTQAFYWHWHQHWCSVFTLYRCSPHLWTYCSCIDGNNSKKHGKVTHRTPLYCLWFTACWHQHFLLLLAGNKLDSEGGGGLPLSWGQRRTFPGVGVWMLNA